MIMQSNRNWWWVVGGLLMVGLLAWAIVPYFSGAKIINPVLFSLGRWQIHWYGALMALAVLLGWQWLEITAKKTRLTFQVVDLVVWVALAGLIGARVLFVILKWPEFGGNLLAMINLTQGGLSIHGAILGGALATFIYCRHYYLPVLKIMDLLVPPLLLGQIIGRLGNFFNQEAFGGPTGLLWKMFVAPQFRPSGLESFSFFHPTFLYEMIGLGLILWLVLIWQKRSLPAGSLVLIYLVSYSILRFFIEWFRIDSDHWGIFTVAQWGSLAIISGGVIIGLILRYKSRKL